MNRTVTSVLTVVGVAMVITLMQPPFGPCAGFTRELYPLVHTSCYIVCAVGKAQNTEDYRVFIILRVKVFRIWKLLHTYHI